MATSPVHPRSRRRRRALVVVGVVVALAAGAVAGAAAAPGLAGRLPWAGSPADEAAAADPVTAAVVRATLTQEVRLSGSLTFGDIAPLPAAEGTITALPAAGAVVGHGEQVYEADGAPVVLFHGERPFWQDLSVDSPRGEDVRQLEQNLRDLGFLGRAPGDRFDWRTRQAVRDWQRSLGVERTGEFAASAVVVVNPALTGESLRIDQVTARLGESDTSPATFGATTLHASANLTQAQARELLPGTPVTLTLADGREIDAALTAIDPGGQPLDDGAVAPARALVHLDEGTLPDDVGPGAVRVTVRGGEEQAATLVVPVSALLATADGGYAVEVWSAGEARRVPVEIGLVADARVQVVGGDLREGDLVVLAR